MENQLKRELVILHFNDAYDIQRDNKGELGFVNFYDYVNRVREKYPQSLLVFSGDAFAPSKLSRFHKGQQMAHCLKMLNIDIACYGNHDFDFPPEHALKLAKSCGFPWLMSNIKYLDTGENIGGGLDYYIMNKNGIKIGFLGLAGPDFNGRLISDYHKKLKYFDIVESAKKNCKQLLKNGCELIIALTHARMPADTDLAKKVPDIDFILGGHDHFSLFQIINQTPIIKSKSDFECLTIVKIFQGSVEEEKSKDVRLGRRWNYISECKKVKQAGKEYPQIQKFIDKALQQYKEYEKGKYNPKNKAKAETQKIPPNNLLLQYGFINNKVAITLSAGLSSQICFAKSVAFKRKCFYSGYRRCAPKLHENFIQQRIKLIKQQIKSQDNLGKTVIFSPGIGSIPYLVETCNMIYLPSHFVVGVDNLDDLAHMLDNQYKKGYECYAVLQYNPFYQNILCAWIKLLRPPRQFTNLIKKKNVENILIMSCSKDLREQGTVKLIKGQDVQEVRYQPQPKDIYIALSDQNIKRQQEMNLIKKIIKDRSQQFWIETQKRSRSNFIGDVEYGIDCVQNLQNYFKLQLCKQKIDYTYILHPDIWSLNLISYHLGREFILRNFDEQIHPIKPRGIVLNQYMLSNPTYELNYGYLPILYMFEDNNKEEKILNVMGEEYQNLKRWFNMYRGSRIGILKHNSDKIATDHQGVDLARWITKYAPKQYNLKYLSVEQMMACLCKLNYLFRLGQDKKFISINDS